jgi:hypothetical protein
MDILKIPPDDATVALAFAQLSSTALGWLMGYSFWNETPLLKIWLESNCPELEPKLSVLSIDTAVIVGQLYAEMPFDEREWLERKVNGVDDEIELKRMVLTRLTLFRRFPVSNLSCAAKFVEDLLPNFLNIGYSWLIAASPAAALGWFLGGRGLVLESILGANCGA